jgi:hypothetical protein
MSDRSSHYSTQGKPRSLTDAQIAEILAWADARRTIKQKAAELGLTAGLVAHVILTRGKQYKQPSPELRAQYLVQDRARRIRLGCAYKM